MWPVVKFVLGIPAEVVVSRAAYRGYTNRSTIAFSPDGKWLGYIWRDATYVYPAELGARPLTMMDALEVRWRVVGQPRQWNAVPLESVDLRPEGRVYFALGARVCFSPDSRRLAANCGESAVLIDLPSGTSQRLQYPEEYIRSLRWRSSDEIVFHTYADSEGAFWRLKVGDQPGERRLLHCEAPPTMLSEAWSPNGRYVVFTSSAGEGPDSYWLLDVDTGALRTIPFSLGYIDWKPDSSGFIAYSDSYSEGLSVVLVNAKDGAAVDLTADFTKAFGEDGISSIRLPWTADGRYVVLSDGYQGCLVQPHPFNILLRKNRFLRASPIPGWVLVQGEDTFTWTDYTGKRTAPIEGWPNGWVWSADGTQAVRIERGEPEPIVFRPVLPPTALKNEKKSP